RLFFYAPRANRYLPSSPTRRSSDLGLTLGDLDAVAGHLEQRHRGLVDRPEPLVLDAAREQLHGPGLTAATGMPPHRPATVGEGTDTGPGAAEPSRDPAGGTELREPRQGAGAHPEQQPAGNEGAHEDLAASSPRHLRHDLGTGPLEGPAVGDHSRADRFASPAAEAEVDDPGEGVVHF